MQNLMQPVNTRALDVTLDALFGPNASQLAGKVYLTVQQAMNEGYELGKLDGANEARDLAKLDAEQNIEERIDAAFDNGYMAGKDQAEQDTDEGRGDAWDEGYVAGVDDARRRPTVADGIVQDIINDAAEEHFEEVAKVNAHREGEEWIDPTTGNFYPDLVTDSGDEA